jgi:glycosyltransferase involved in cell wall biosynthesis
MMAEVHHARDRLEGLPSAAMPSRLLMVVNSAEFFLSHRLPVALAARAAGLDVHIATPAGEGVDRIEAFGLVHHAFALSRSGGNVFGELGTLYFLFRLFRSIRPDLVHLVTIKPVLYGGIAARLARVPAVVAAVSGMGFVFMAEGRLARIRRSLVSFLYRRVFGKDRLKVIFQNEEDRVGMMGLGLDGGKTVLIRGSGVRLEDYPVEAMPAGTPVVVMAARLLADKGVREFVQAARLLKSRGVPVQMRLAGAPDPGNPTAIAASELAAWQAEGIVHLLGYRKDMAAVLSQAHVVALPSYREGLPKVLIEAAASGRAVVTTDVPGCRDAIEPGVTGLLVPVKNADALADAIEMLLADPAYCQRLGNAGRRFAEVEFDISRVVAEHLKIYEKLGLGLPIPM